MTFETFAIFVFAVSATSAEQIGVEILPLVVLVDRDAGVDERHRHFVERRVDLRAGRDELAIGDDLLPLGAQLEVVEENGRIRMRRAPRDADAVGPRDRVADGEPVDRGALAA